MSRRERLRQRRAEERRRRILSLALVVGGLAAITAGLLILPNLTPIGEFETVPPRQRPFEDGPELGAPDAPVVIEIFEDFQCPACRRFTELTEERLEQDWIASGDVRLIFRQFPFIGPESQQAALASTCAADQGRFWDYHDILFANQIGENVGAFTERRLLAFADSLDLDMTEFEGCLENEVHQDRIEADRALGIEYGVSGTPAIIINGTQHFAGFVPNYEQLNAAIVEELQG